MRYSVLNETILVQHVSRWLSLGYLWAILAAGPSFETSDALSEHGTEVDLESLTIAERIHQSLAMLTPTERKAASQLMSDYPFPGLETVAAFAKRSGVSNPTILRLVTKLGFRTYADFQLGLREELQARLGSPLMRGGAFKAQQDREDGPLDRFGRSVLNSIERSLAGVPPATLEGVLKLLMDPKRRLHFLGGRLTRGIALQFYLYVREMRDGVHLVESQNAAWAHELLEMNKRSVLFVFDIRRYQDDVIRFAHQAAAAGAHVILFTDEWMSPIAADSHHVVALHTRVASNWDTIAPFLVLIESLVTRFSAGAWDDVKVRMEIIEAARADLAPGRDP